MRKLTGKWKLQPQHFGRYKVLVEVQVWPTNEFRRLAPHWVGYVQAGPGDLEYLQIKTD